MTKSFKTLRNKMSAKACLESEQKTKQFLQKMRLDELRKLKQKTQEDVAKTLDVEQPYISKLERQSDMYISRLRKYIEAMGGALEITARFPEVDVKINQFEELK